MIPWTRNFPRIGATLQAMLTPLPILLLLALPPDGPPAPPLRGVAQVRSSPLPLWHARGVRALAGEASATVQVEDSLPIFAPILERYRISRKLSFQFKDWLKAAPLEALPPPLWMDPNVVTAGGNVVHQNFTIGGVR